MKGLLFLYLLFLSLLFHCTHSHVLVKRHTHQHRPKANPRDLLNDFVAISEAGGLEPAPLKNFVEQHVYDAGDVSSACGGSKTSSGGCDSIVCNVKEVMTPNNSKSKSCAIAIQAAQDAKAASEAQFAAGYAASQHIKTELAEKAFQSAKAAEAALCGKQHMVHQLEKATQEASAVIEGETAALQTIEANMNAAVEATKAATQQFEALSELVTNSKNNLANIQSVALGLQQEMEAKTQLLEAARSRLAACQKQLCCAREDYEKTKQAAYKAACAAVEAKQKAASSQCSRSGAKRSQRRNRNCPNSS
nr:uncharacterized protein LOC108076209 isoform X2 [Drosophila kikkawai]